MRRWLRVVPAVTVSVAASAVLYAAPASAEPYRPCQVDDGRLVEASGAVASGRGDGVWFSHNDSGRPARAVVVDDDCRVLGEVGWGRDEVDVEDLARADVDGLPSLFFADTGDNAQTRDEVGIVRIPLPEAPYGGTVDPAVFPLRYPDGPRDAETLLLSPDGSVAVLVEKSMRRGAGLYAADLRRAGEAATLVRLGEVRLPDRSPEARAVTSGRVSPDGRFVALRTYADVVVYALPPQGSFATRVAQGLAGDGVAVDVPDQPQGEALDWDDDGLRLVSEGRPTDVVRVPTADLPTPTVTTRRVRLR